MPRVPRAPVPPRLVPRLLHLLILLPAALVLCPGCSDDDPAEAPSAENFARAWRLTSCVYRSEAGGATSIDLVAAGWVIDLMVNDNGRLRYAWTPPGGDETFWDGSWSVDGSTVAVTRDGFGFSWEFEAGVHESTMSLTGAHAEYDFDSDGTPEAATWDLAGTTG